MIDPRPVGDVRFAHAKFGSPYGVIGSDWKMQNNSFDLSAEIPVNTTAMVYLPVTGTSVITENGHSLSNNRDVQMIGVKNGKAILCIGSGKYHFLVN